MLIEIRSKEQSGSTEGMQVVARNLYALCNEPPLPHLPKKKIRNNLWRLCMIKFAGNIDHLIAQLKTRCYRFRQPETDLGTRVMELEADSNLHHV